MKKFMMAGGFLGFLCGLLCGTWQGGAWPSVLWRASVAALGAGLLLRWWAGVWVRSCHELTREPAVATVAGAKLTTGPAIPKR